MRSGRLEGSVPLVVDVKTRLVAGLVCCTSGGALILHILTGSPLWLGLAALGFGTSALLAVVLLSGADQISSSLRTTGLGRILSRGVVVGLVSTAAYDSSRWILVQLGGMRVSPFEALPLFGQALIGTDRPELWVQDIQSDDIVAECLELVPTPPSVPDRGQS